MFETTDRCKYVVMMQGASDIISNGTMPVLYRLSCPLEALAASERVYVRDGNDVDRFVALDRIEPRQILARLEK